jgi:hypothetical protein
MSAGHIITRGYGGLTIVTRGYGISSFTATIYREVKRVFSRIVQTINLESIIDGND